MMRFIFGCRGKRPGASAWNASQGKPNAAGKGLSRSEVREVLVNAMFILTEDVKNA